MEKNQSCKKQKKYKEKTNEDKITPPCIEIDKEDQIQDLSKKLNGLTLQAQKDSDQSISKQASQTVTTQKDKVQVQAYVNVNVNVNLKAKNKTIQTDTQSSEQQISQNQYQDFVLKSCKVHGKCRIAQSKLQKSASYHHISAQWYEKIRKIWKKSQNHSQIILKKVQRVTHVEKITSYMLKHLKPKHWLNDQVINCYFDLLKLDVIEKNFPARQKDKTHKISITVMRTHFTPYTNTPQKMERQIERQKLNTQSLIFVPIMEDFHWFLLIIFHRNVFIFDSLLPKQKLQTQDLYKKHYLAKKGVKTCLRLYQKIYGVQEIAMKNLILVQNFPQQNNQSDCGVMILCGAKNILKRLVQLKNHNQDLKFVSKMLKTQTFWKFCVEDSKYFRYLFCRQIIEEKIHEY